jgi:multidrug transporter EmrE-like cation transporter
LTSSDTRIVLQLSYSPTSNLAHPKYQAAMKLILLILLVCGGVLLTVLADVFLKKSSGQNVGFLILGLILYASVAYPVALAFRLTEFGELFLIWETATVILGIAIATAVFRERLSLQRVLALILVITALILSYGR